jgi:hypothetical protein
MITVTAARRLPWWPVALVAVIASVLSATVSWASPTGAVITGSYSYDASQQLSPPTKVALANSLATIVDLDKRLDFLTSGSRSDMLNLERFIVERDPGPWNFERWAGNFAGDVP